MARVVSALACFGAMTSLVAATACVKDDTSTQITVAIWSEAQVPSQMNSIEVKVYASDGSLKNDQYYPVGDPNDVASFPATLSVVPSDSSSLDAPVTVEVDGYSGASPDGTGGTLELTRRAVVSFVEGRSLYLPMPLRMACLDQENSCSSGESCVGGTCVTPDVSSSTLADYTPAVLFGTTPGAICFDETSCLGGSTAVTVTPTLDPTTGAVTDCTFPLPAGEDVNVSILWQDAEQRIIALDSSSPLEGWTVDAKNAAVGHLSVGICEALAEPLTATGTPEPYVADKAVSAWISTKCPAKTPLQPFCTRLDGSGIGTGIPLTAN